MAINPLIIVDERESVETIRSLERRARAAKDFDHADMLRDIIREAEAGLALQELESKEI